MSRVLKYIPEFNKEELNSLAKAFKLFADRNVAINVDADILLIDEILAVGDKHFQEKCFNKLRELKAAGKTIVIVTHSMDQVRKFCDRAIWLYKGDVKMDGNVDEVLQEYEKVCG